MAPSNFSKLFLDEHGESYCWTCEKWFRTANRARSHARQAAVHAGGWCEQCDRLFVSPHTLDDHVANSSAHRSSNYSDEGYLTESESYEPSEEEHDGYESEEQNYHSYHHQHNRTVQRYTGHQTHQSQGYQVIIINPYPYLSSPPTVRVLRMLWLL